MQVANGRAWLARPRLLDLMDRGLAGPTTVLSAPAGSGKSGLVQEWMDDNDGPRVAIVRVRPGDDAPQLAAHLFAAAGRLTGHTDEPIPQGIPESRRVLGRCFVETLVGRL